MRTIHWLGLALLVVALWAGTLTQRSESAISPWESPSLEEVSSQLEGLSFDAFVETSYRLYVLRFPETVTRMGMASTFGVRNDRLNDYSLEYVEETHAIESEILSQLLSYDRTGLSDQQQVTYDVCTWYWNNLVQLQPFSDYDYPISHFFVTSRDYLFYDLMTEAHPIDSVENAQDYITRLEQVGTQFDQVIAGLDRRAAAGIVLPRTMIDWALGGLRAMASGTAHDAYYISFQDRLAETAGIKASTQEELLASAEEAVQDVVLPAYQRLSDKMVELRAIAPVEIGFGQVQEGSAFYDAILRHYTGTDLTAQQIHDMGLREVERLQEEIRETAAGLGYSGSMTMASIFAFAATNGGSLTDSAILSRYTELVEQAKEAALTAISSMPQTNVEVIEHPSGGFYQAAPRDGSRPAVFGARVRGSQASYTMPTLTYHETVPGHHLQIATAQELPLPLLQNEETFLGFTEGWALYAERLAWELGWYEDDPYGNLGRLQFEIMRAARLVVDTGIHALSWGNDRAKAYYQEATGKDERNAQYDIYRYAVWPGQATSYMVGMLRILELRSSAQQALGENFDLLAFHDTLLGQGGIPLGLLDGIVEQFIEDNI